MHAVAVAAVCRVPENLREIVTYLLVLHVERTESLDTRGIDYPAALGQREHLGECGGMHAGIMLL